MIYAKWKLILFGVVLLVGSKLLYNWGYDVADTKNKLAHEKHLKEDAENARAAEETQRRIEQDRELVRETQEQDYLSRLSDAQRGSSDSAIALAGMREELARTREKLRRASEASSLPGVNDGATKAAMVLSDMLSKATGELQKVAGTADEWYVNATQCQQFYQEIRGQ